MVDHRNIFLPWYHLELLTEISWNISAQHLNQQLHGPQNPSSLLQNNQGLLGGSNLMPGGTSSFSGGFGSGGLPHSSLMAYPPPLNPNNNNSNNSNTNNIENAGGFPNRS